MTKKYNFNNKEKTMRVANLAKMTVWINCSKDRFNIGFCAFEWPDHQLTLTWGINKSEGIWFNIAIR